MDSSKIFIFFIVFILDNFNLFVFIFGLLLILFLQITYQNMSVDCSGASVNGTSQAHSNARFYKIGHYLIKQLIGQGGYGKVFKAIQLYTKEQLAVKIIKLDGINSKKINKIQQQIQIQRNLSHPNIVRIYEVIRTDGQILIFMQLAKGVELFKYITKYGPLKQNMAAKVLYQITLAVKYLHDRKIVHRDIKTQNIIVDQNFNAKLIDFGLAKDLNKKCKQFSETICGSPSYNAPQIIEKKKYLGQKIDVWCLGVSLYVMIQATFPFQHEGKSQQKNNIRLLNWSPIIYSSNEAVEIYQSIFTYSEERIGVDQLLNTNFFQKYSSLSLNKFKNVNLKQYQKQQIYSKISSWLDKSQSDIKVDILNNQLGESLSIYHLLLKQKLNNEQHIVKNQSFYINLRTKKSLKNRQGFIQKAQRRNVFSKGSINLNTTHQQNDISRLAISQVKKYVKTCPSDQKDKKLLPVMQSFKNSFLDQSPIVRNVKRFSIEAQMKDRTIQKLTSRRMFNSKNFMKKTNQIIGVQQQDVCFRQSLHKALNCRKKYK